MGARMECQKSEGTIKSSCVLDLSEPATRRQFMIKSVIFSACLFSLLLASFALPGIALADKIQPLNHIEVIVMDGETVAKKGPRGVPYVLSENGARLRVVLSAGQSGFLSDVTEHFDVLAVDLQGQERVVAASEFVANNLGYYSLAIVGRTSNELGDFTAYTLQATFSVERAALAAFQPREVVYSCAPSMGTDELQISGYLRLAPEEIGLTSVEKESLTLSMRRVGQEGASEYLKTSSLTLFPAQGLGAQQTARFSPETQPQSWADNCEYSIAFSFFVPEDELGGCPEDVTLMGHASLNSQPLRVLVPIVADGDVTKVETMSAAAGDDLQAIICNGEVYPDSGLGYIEECPCVVEGGNPGQPTCGWQFDAVLTDKEEDFSETNKPFYFFQAPLTPPFVPGTPDDPNFWGSMSYDFSSNLKSSTGNFKADLKNPDVACEAHSRAMACQEVPSVCADGPGLSPHASDEDHMAFYSAKLRHRRLCLKKAPHLGLPQSKEIMSKAKFTLKLVPETCCQNCKIQHEGKSVGNATAQGSSGFKPAEIEQVTHGSVAGYIADITTACLSDTDLSHLDEAIQWDQKKGGNNRRGIVIGQASGWPSDSKLLPASDPEKYILIKDNGNNASDQMPSNLELNCLLDGPCEASGTAHNLSLVGYQMQNYYDSTMTQSVHHSGGIGLIFKWHHGVSTAEPVLKWIESSTHGTAESSTTLTLTGEAPCEGVESNGDEFLLAISRGSL